MKMKIQPIKICGNSVQRQCLGGNLKEGILQINNLNFHLKNPEKKIKIKPNKHELRK